MEQEERIYGPVPSRRFGRSLGVNNIPHKVCSYSCAYCQVGKGYRIVTQRERFYPPEELVREVEQKLKQLEQSGYPDYISIVPDGEPTLDLNLGKLITKLRKLGIPVAVITNSSLIPMKEVQSALSHADLVSVKVDTVTPEIWKRLNKPHKTLDLDQILGSLNHFTNSYSGKLITETMLIKDFNDSDKELSRIAQYLQSIKPATAYVGIPTRPTAFSNAFPPSKETVLRAHEIFYWHCLDVELLTGYEGNAFSSTGNFTRDLLSITAVHPMRKEAVEKLMQKTQTQPKELQTLIAEGKIDEITYEGETFYLRNFGKPDT